MTLKDVCEAVDRLAPPGLAYPWDRAGLACGSPSAEVTSALVALSVNAEALAAARKAGAQVIVSHHPLIWQPLDSLREDQPHTALCLEAVRSGIACYSAHTSLDLAEDGVNDALAARLGIEETAPLLPAPHAGLVKLVTFVPEEYLAAVRGAVCEAGAGRIGDYAHCAFSHGGTGTFIPGDSTDPYSGRKGQLNEEAERRMEVLSGKSELPRVLDALRRAHPYEEPAYDVYPLSGPDPRVGLGRAGALATPGPLGDFARAVCELLDLDAVRLIGDPAREVRRVGVLGGAGGGEVGAIPGGIDVFVTGDVSYHDAEAACERGLAVIDAGHAGTELPGVHALANHLERELPDIDVTLFRERPLITTIPERR